MEALGSESTEPAAPRRPKRQDRAIALLSAIRLRPHDTNTAEGRSQERLRRVALTAGASALSKMMSVATLLVSIPLTLNYLGKELFGVWMTLSSFIALLSFTDLGIGYGLMSRVAAEYGRGNIVAIRTAVSSAYLSVAAIAAALSTIFAFLLWPKVEWTAIFNVADPKLKAEIAGAVLVFAACYAIGLPVNLIQRAQMGLQSGFTPSLWQCLSSVLTLAAVLTVSLLHLPLPYVVAAFMVPPLATALANTLVFFGFLRRDISPRLASFSTESAIDVLRYGGLFLALQIAGAILYYSDNFIIAQKLGAATVPTYAVPERLFSLVAAIVAMALGPLWPAYGEALAKGDIEWARRAMRTSLRTSVAGSALLVLLLLAVSPWLIPIWTSGQVTPPLLLLILLGTWRVVEAAGGSFSMYLNGSRVIAFQILTAVATCAVALPLKFLFVGSIGPAGPILATLLSYVLFTLIPTAIFVNRRLAQSGGTVR